MEFGPRFKKILEENKITQAKFCEDTDIHKGQASAYLSGKERPSADFIIKAIAYFPDVDVNYLFGDIKKGGEGVEEPIAEYSSLTPDKIIKDIEWRLKQLKKQLAKK